MNNPSVAPVVSITLAGEERRLYFGFRAFKELGLNPFKPAELLSYLDSENLDIDHAAKWVRAGLLQEYTRSGARHGQEPPTVDEVIDMLDVPAFLRIVKDGLEAAGLKSDEKREAGAQEAEQDPPKA